MKVILIQGAKNTGKTTLCNRIDEWLQRESLKEQQKTFRIEMTKHFSKKNDFFAVYDIYTNKTNKNPEELDVFKARIFINSGSEEECITPFERFYKNENEEYYKNKPQADLVITAIRPSGTDSNKIIEVLNMNNSEKLNLDDLEELKLSPKTIYSYQEDTSKDILLIQLEKTPLELIKEEIRKLFK